MTLITQFCNADPRGQVNGLWLLIAARAKALDDVGAIAGEVPAAVIALGTRTTHARLDHRQRHGLRRQRAVLAWVLIAAAGAGQSVVITHNIRSVGNVCKDKLSLE